MILRFFQFVLVALSLCIVALLAAITTMHFAIHGAEVKVPDFRGMDVAEATSRAAQMDLNLTVDQHFYSATTAVGHVLTQSPAPGTSVRIEWNVRVTDSLGAQRVAIPKVTGLAERVATFNVRKLGLDLGTIARMPYGAQPPGMVIAQTPQPGAANVDRPNVSLLLSTPPQHDLTAFVMPDLIDSNYADAAASVTRAGLKLGPVQYRNVGIPAVAAVDTAGIPQPPRPPLPPGIILAQAPDAGMHIDSNTVIELTVSQ